MIVITAATGHLGTHVVNQLVEAGFADQLRLAVRSPEKAAAWADSGIEVVAADYDDPSSLEAAFKGAEKLLLISSSAVGERARQHANAITAARSAGVSLIAYTSILHADTSSTILAVEHRATEAALLDSGIDHVLLRNGWYTENYTENLAGALTAGTFIGSAGEGRISAATRADYAAAAVAVLTTEGQSGKTYELAGDDSFSMQELAGATAELTGKTINYADMPQAVYSETLEGFGVPAGFADALANADVAISQGELEDNSRTLSELIRRPTTSWRETLAAALA